MTMGIQQLMWQMERAADTFHRAVFADRDVDAALVVAEPDCVLTQLPAGTGSAGDLRRHLAGEVVGHLPADLSFRRVSRTVDQRRVVDELTVGFTHDRELPWLLPGVAPTGRRAEVLAISVIGFRHTTQLGVTRSRVAAHRTLWDHATLLAQLDLHPTPATPT